MNTREYPYEMRVMLNAAYDVLDAMALPMGYVDSREGVLRFRKGGEIGLTAVERNGSEITRVEITDTGQALCDVLFDELSAALQQNFETIRRTPV